MIVRSDVQWLNPIDCTIRCVDVAARQMGYPGIETQLLVELEGRVDATALRTAIARLSRRHPVVASRLVEPHGGQGRFHWQFRPGAVCPLVETSLASDETETVLDHAGEVLSGGRDPTEADPLEFHLLHRPGGNDVLLVQYNHVLMDNTVAIPLLRELDRLSRADVNPARQGQPEKLVFEHLRQFPAAVRRDAIQAAIQLQAHALRGRAATLLLVGPAPPGQARLRMAARTLDPAETADFRSRIVALCGFPCLSMAILGSAFRAIHEFGPAADPRQDFVAGIGIPLTRNDRELLLQNLTSAVPIRVRRGDLADRDRLVRLLGDQLRQRLAANVDLGILGTTAIFSRRLRYVEWVVWHLLRYGYSLWYAYFGNLDAAGERFCGARITDLFHAGGPVWPSIGLTLLVNQCHGQLHFQATYDPRLLSASRVETFLDFVLTDLPRGVSAVESAQPFGIV
jgi:hypothetical protein